MNAEQLTESRRVKKRYSAEDRKRVISEYEASGKNRDDFCRERGIKPGTFHWWLSEHRKAKRAKPKLAQVEVTAPAAPIELELPGGLRIGVRLNGKSGELAKLIRSILSC